MPNITTASAEVSDATSELMDATTSGTGTALTDATTGTARAVTDTAPTVRALVEASISDNTRRAYTGAIQRIDDAVAGRTLDDESLAEYIASQHQAGRAPASASLTVAALKFRSKLEGVTSPVGPMTGRVLAGIRRDGQGRGRGQVAGVQWAQADAIAAIAANGERSIAGVRDAAIVAIASDGLLRVSEVSALDTGDVVAEADGSGRVTVRRSKTDQEGKGSVLFVGPPTMRRVGAWVAAAGITEGPLFRGLRRGGRVTTARLSSQSIRAVITRRAAALDSVDGRISGHSLRVGAAQSLAVAGAGLVELQTVGRWQSPAMPTHYARGALAARGAVAKLRYGAK